MYYWWSVVANRDKKIRTLIKLYSELSLCPQELKNLIPKSAVGTLSANSSNVINLIIDAYNVSPLLRLLTVRSYHLLTWTTLKRWTLWPSSKLFPHKTFSFKTELSLCVLYTVKTKLPDDIPVQEIATFILLSLGFWQSLSSEVILENSKLPEGLTIAYISRCKNGVVSEGENGRKCSNISIGDEVRIRKMFNFFSCILSVDKSTCLLSKHAPP